MATNSSNNNNNNVGITQISSKSSLKK